MTPERIFELRMHCKAEIDECLDAIEALQLENDSLKHEPCGNCAALERTNEALQRQLGALVQ